MLMANIQVEERFCIKTNDREKLEGTMESLTELPEVFICANDFVAVDVMHALRDIGKTVPEDVMIAGFDDSAESRMITPQMTTVHIHSQIMAYSATQLLIARIEEPRLDFRSVYTETELIYRETAFL